MPSNGASHVEVRILVVIRGMHQGREVLLSIQSDARKSWVIGHCRGGNKEEHVLFVKWCHIWMIPEPYTETINGAKAISGE